MCVCLCVYMSATCVQEPVVVKETLDRPEPELIDKCELSCGC